MINGIKKAFDVQINNKIMIKTIVARLPDGIMTASLWPIAKRTVVKVGFCGHFSLIDPPVSF
jgi:hypothetical protein